MDHGKFRKKWLVFHGTASAALEGIVRAGGVVPWDVLEARNIVTPTGEQFFTLEPGTVGRRAVSVVRNPKIAAEYALHSSVVSRALDEEVLSEARNLFEELQSEKAGGRINWGYLQSLSRTVGPKLRALFSKRRLDTDQRYSVIIATVSKRPSPAEYYDKYGVFTPGEELLVQLPLHRSYVFVPAEYVNHARSILARRGPEYAERVFPLDVLEALYKKELKGKGLFD
jgi:hypothetical protein